MRIWLCCILLVCLPCLGADADPHKEWLDFKKQFSEYAAGPTGLYTIQDMRELRAGEATSLPRHARNADARWTKATEKNSLVTVSYRDGKAMLAGPGIEPGDLLQRKEKQQRLPNGMTVLATQRESALKLWLLNPDLLKVRGFKGLTYFPFNTAGVIEGDFHRKLVPVGVNHLDSRNHSGLMYWIGDVKTTIDGKPYTLRAFNYSKDWDKLDHFLLFFRDRTSGKTTYGGGRVIEIHFPKGSPPSKVRINLNLLYSFLCAHSDFFNCPVNLTAFIDTELVYGEKYPPSRL